VNRGCHGPPRSPGRPWGRRADCRSESTRWHRDRAGRPGPGTYARRWKRALRRFRADERMVVDIDERPRGLSATATRSCSPPPCSAGRTDPRVRRRPEPRRRRRSTPQPARVPRPCPGTPTCPDQSSSSTRRLLIVGRVEVPGAVGLDHVRVGRPACIRQLQVFSVARAAGPRLVDRPDVLRRQDRIPFHVNQAVLLLVRVVELGVAVSVDVGLGLDQSRACDRPRQRRPVLPSCTTRIRRTR